MGLFNMLDQLRESIAPTGSTRNWWRLSGDLLHFLAVFILPMKIWLSKSARGVSAKTQMLLTATFLCRYTDLISGEEPTTGRRTAFRWLQ